MKLTTEQFVSKALAKHGKKYNYEKVVYVSAKTPVVITCPKHGDFQQTPNGHLFAKVGCQHCAYECLVNRERHNIEIFIQAARKIHGDLYSYTKSKYVNSQTKLIIGCKHHGDFLQTPTSHIQGRDCPLCGTIKQSDMLRLGGEEFVKRAKFQHGNKYDYSKVEYVHKDKLITISCPKHGDFQQSPHNHTKGAGCPVCRESRGERRIRQYFEINNIEFKSQHKFDTCRNKRPLPFDFTIEHNGIKAIEFHGQQHYRPMGFVGHTDGRSRLNRSVITDSIKYEWCKQNHVPLLVIPYTKYDDIENILDEFLR